MTKKKDISFFEPVIIYKISKKENNGKKQETLKSQDSVAESEYDSESDINTSRWQAILAHSGLYHYRAFELQQYDRPPMELISVFRPSEALFASKTIKSFDNALVTLNHPSKLLQDQNVDHPSVQSHIVGAVKNVQRDPQNDTLLIGDIDIHDESALPIIQSDHNQVSIGYTFSLRESLGVLEENGETHEYEFIQEDILGDHVALVTESRGGCLCKIDLNSAQKEKQLAKSGMDAANMARTLFSMSSFLDPAHVGGRSLFMQRLAEFYKKG